MHYLINKIHFYPLFLSSVMVDVVILYFCHGICIFHRFQSWYLCLPFLSCLVFLYLVPIPVKVFVSTLFTVMVGGSDYKSTQSCIGCYSSHHVFTIPPVIYSDSPHLCFGVWGEYGWDYIFSLLQRPVFTKKIWWFWLTTFSLVL